MKNHKYVLTAILSFFFLPVLSQHKLSAGQHFAMINGVKVHYYVAGKGPVCLFPSPGWGVSVDYLLTMKTFEKYFTVVYYDTRHSGLSVATDDSTKYTNKDFIDDMDSLRVYLAQPKIWLAGHSGSGYLALLYGIDHSEQLNGIIAIDALATRDSLSRVEYKKMSAKHKIAVTAYRKLHPVETNSSDSTMGMLAKTIKQILPYYFHDIEKMKLFPTKNVTFNDQAYAYIESCHLYEEDLLPGLPKITVPVLVISGDDDYICDVYSQAMRIHHAIHGASLGIIPGSGHFPWIEQPVAFESVCQAWFQEQKLQRTN
jgi:pimeloyl-ACP methyl ester carboxylesterase